MSSHFERLQAHTVFEGTVVDVCEGTFRHEDGKEVTRQWVTHPGSVGIVAHDGEHIWLVRQPREATGDPDLLELPAGKLDEEGEDVLTTAKRELAEEIGKGAWTWEHLTTFYSSPGFSDEVVHVYLATDLYDEKAAAAEDERIEIRAVPLGQLDDAIADCRDAKSLVGLLWFKAYREGRP
jgi:8-oxo-dGTP pyrophosphatase MutT (NUDIX family)